VSGLSTPDKERGKADPHESFLDQLERITTLDYVPSDGKGLAISLL
jgi:hypothetical protein